MIDKLKIAVGATLFCASLVTLAILSQYGAFDWAFTPNGKQRVYLFLVAVIVVLLASWGIHVHRSDRAKKRARAEAAEETAYDVWLPTLTGEMPAIRAISRADLDAAAEDLDRWQEDMLANVEAALPESWRRLTPAELDYAPVYVPPPPPEPEYVPAVAAWDPLQRAEESYAGRAAWFANDLRAGVPVYDEQAEAARVMAGMRRATPSRPMLPVMVLGPPAVIDAPVSPAAPSHHRPRHALNTAPDTRTQQALWESDTGAWPVVTRELVGAVS